MKKLLPPLPLSLLLLPLLARADPHFGPHFERELLLALAWALLGLPLLVAQLVGWAARARRLGLVRGAALLATWLGTALLLGGVLKVPGDGLLSAAGYWRLALFATLGAGGPGCPAARRPLTPKSPRQTRTRAFKYVAGSH